MSGLQKKLSLGFGVLLLIVIIIGSQSIVELTKLGDSIDVILRENYNSVVACQKMKESLERIDSGILFVLLGDRMRGKELIERNFTLFEDALKVELNNITLPGEGKKAIDIKKLYEQYKALVDKVILPGAPISFQKKTYFQELFPIFQVIKDNADEVLQMNQRNMNEANEAARLKAAFSRKVMYVLLLAGIMVASAFFLLTTRWILRPINRLIKSAEEIGRGNLDLVIDSSSRDEIGRLSEAFNSMAAGLREFRRSDHARLFYIEHLTQRVFDRLPEAVVVLDADGNVEIATEIARNIFGLKVNANLRDLKLPLASNIFQRAAASGFKTVPEGKETVIQQFLNGVEKFFQPEATPILNEERQFTGAVLLLKDVTDSLQQNEMKKGIVSTVSHQLKTPLTSIRMAIHVLLEEKVGPLSEKQVELLLAAQEDSDRLYNILSNLLDISRIESGGAGMSFRKEDANELALDAVDSFAFAA
ncbi:MAG TPA: HAMP domain-containing protein, partial [Syntrophorhabdaceae bacterium]|nr:HAMP domain-containing protein [Syntrophorhabdaceae bacterium]